MDAARPVNAATALASPAGPRRQDAHHGNVEEQKELVRLESLWIDQLLPQCNLFGYCQVASAYGSGNFINVLHEHLHNDPKVLTSRVNAKDDIYDSIKTFFAKRH